MSKGPLKSTDKRRAGYSNNVSSAVGQNKGNRKSNGTSKGSANEFHAGRNGHSKRSQ